MNLLLAILLGTGAVIGALGMLALIAGGVATAMIEADCDGAVVETTGRPLSRRRASPIDAPATAAVAARSSSVLRTSTQAAA